MRILLDWLVIKVWLKKEYAVHIEPNNKAYIYSIYENNGELISHEFQIVPYGVAAVINIVGSGYETSEVINYLSKKGMNRDKAENIVNTILTKYRHLFTEVQPEKKYDSVSIAKLTSQFGKLPFDYVNKKYKFPKNIILEVSCDSTKYISVDKVRKIHADCYAGGTEKIFYCGDNVLNWNLLFAFIEKNTYHKIESIVKTNLCVEPICLKKIVQCSFTKLQVVCNNITAAVLQNFKILINNRMPFDLFLSNMQFEDLARIPFNDFSNQLKNTYIVDNQSSQQIKRKILLLKKYGINPIEIPGCTNTAFGERSCFKSGVMNLAFSCDGKAVFCLVGGRHNVLGNIENDSIENIWKRFDASVENRKKLFATCDKLKN